MQIATNGAESSSTRQVILYLLKDSQAHSAVHTTDFSPAKQNQPPSAWHPAATQFSVIAGYEAHTMIYLAVALHFLVINGIPTKELDGIFLILWQLSPYVDCGFIVCVVSRLIVISSPYSAVVWDEAWDDLIKRLNNLTEEAYRLKRIYFPMWSYNSFFLQQRFPSLCSHQSRMKLLTWHQRPRPQLLGLCLWPRELGRTLNRQRQSTVTEVNKLDQVPKQINHNANAPHWQSPPTRQ